MVLCACTVESSEETAAASDNMREYCKTYASEYETVQNGDDIRIRVIAPDFSMLLDEMVRTGKDVSLEELKAQVEAHPDMTKTYEFPAAEESEDAVQEAFLDQVAKELMIDAIVRLEDGEERGME